MDRNKSTKREKLVINKFLKEWVLPIVSAIILALLINKFLFFNVYVPTGSMIPTININDKGLVSIVHDAQNLKRGDIIVFYSNEFNENLVKRLIGLPGDKIEIKNGAVFVNGEELKEDYVKNKDKYNGTFEVPKGKYFFLGDNRPDSADSRYWKDPYVDASDIKGKFQFVFYPFKDFGLLSNK
ncbi:signal peptidase I [Clostridium saccharobutylicum]|uniref:Signal peptidase I n=1 Tax=Clostridium saccharobutylicum DSM 13864 TaxID=1345695 RepID=U5MM97_CLOSA|nr:signal peptidase I [Clostridium saccharobutylicum]AGX41725.1 signal peptidase I P [Clostridium saccharobutylicum DSM 13864]AQR89005.1 signal peptidase I P [Clostridium saccharobutylicum]AQR98906.1 signal peptidase I P [Clostridium saccharobutylicum]AQS08625.1 signal peptidase I P [Clostridium saccharobutylicum]AQS12894.1 signal peptidase I P [Clostridium saccharobutylicum]